jgi:NitT/TauT family transport system permease protein
VAVVVTPLPGVTSAAEPSTRSGARRRVRRILMFPISFLLVAALWELYKAIGPEDGASLLGVRLLPRTNELSMPHVWDMVQRLTEPEVRGGSDSVFRVVAFATWYSFRTAFTAFVIGSLFGIALAVVMARFKVVERALMPYIVLSQTVPIIVLGPLIMSLIGYASRDWATEYWAGAIVLGVFLAFFPVALGALRGLQSAPPAALELMDSYAAGWWRTLFKLRFPAAVPFIAPALRIAGAAAVVGVVVSEISLGVPQGVGRKILAYGMEASSDPSKMYAAVFGAAVLGIAMSLIVVAIDRQLMRNRPQEST